LAKRVLLFVICYLLFTFCATFVWAQADEGRPLRTVPSASYRSPMPAVHTLSVGPISLLVPSILEQPLTQYYIAQYSSSGGIAYLNAVMERGSIYLPFIMEEIEKRALPPELAYLPVIESGFLPTARSRSGAVGLWQFMMNSISPFNIKVNEIVDERRDFLKATRGALQKLDDNYRALGNWELALAAYNAGLGAVTRAIQREKINDYWELSRLKAIPTETIHYVPKLAATAYILSQPRRFGIENWEQAEEWAAIPLNRQVSLDILAAEADINRDLLRRLNAELLFGISPADSSYQLKVPAAQLEQINLVLEREDLRLIRYHYHVVRSGDTLWSMSRYYGTSIEIIEQHNPGLKNRYLRIGETIIIPAFRDVTPPVRQVLAQSLDGQYIVQKGDTLWSLSIRYGIDPQLLAESNNMELNQILREGRALKVPIIEQ